jgi:hypothetical protein
VPENETILYRGSSFELGHGSGFYGIWPSGSPRPASIEWWPDTPDGWQGAWARYNALEVPGSITMVGSQQQQRQAAGHLSTRALIAGGLLAAGIICGLAGLFPSYLAGSSLASQASQVIPHVFYLAGWTASLVLILLGGARLRVGVLLSLGLSIVTFGLFFSDAGQVIAGGAHLMGAGLALSLIGWLACAAGSVVALPLEAGFFRRSVTHVRSTFNPAPDAPAPQAAQIPPTPFPATAEPATAASTEPEPEAEETENVPAPATYGSYGAYQPARTSRWSNRVSRRAILAVSLAVIAALGVAITFWPSWDSYTLRTAAGEVHSLTAGNAFSNPAAVIVGDVAVMVALVLVAVVAALWRPVRLGAVLLAGALIPMVAQAVSALAQLAEPVSSTQFGISSAEASQLGLTISQGLTPVFWIYCVFVVALAVICGWLFIVPRRTSQAVAPAALGTYT